MIEQAGVYALTEALGRADSASTDTLMVKTKAANIAEDLYLDIVLYWQNKMSGAAVKGDQLTKWNTDANQDQAPANSLVQTEEGVASQVGQAMANLIHSLSDIVTVISFAAQAQLNQS